MLEIKSHRKNRLPGKKWGHSQQNILQCNHHNGGVRLIPTVSVLWGILSCADVRRQRSSSTSMA